MTADERPGRGPTASAQTADEHRRRHVRDEKQRAFYKGLLQFAVSTTRGS
jgi:hypothetical protein